MSACFASSGGLAVRAGANAVLVQSTIADCDVGLVSGGGLHLYQANATLKGESRIERCTGRRGAAVVAYDADLELLEGSAVRECHASFIAGGMHLWPELHQSAPSRSCARPRARGDDGHVHVPCGCPASSC